MMNQDCTKILLVENYISTNSWKIAWHVTKIDEDMRNFPETFDKCTEDKNSWCAKQEK